ncbi:MAG TPA: TIGR02996 domain-containing protein [Fimbriiglobus sp.]
MTDPADLLPAVLAAPDDDLPRLVYADALEETGDVARAEFIRVQIELARDPTRADLKAREAVLLAVHGEQWLAPLRRKGEAFESQSTHGQFRRGFVEIVWMPAFWFVRRADRLFDSTPVTELRVLSATTAQFSDLRSSPYFSRLRWLDLSDRKIGDEGATSLFLGKPPKLRGLRLRACNLTDWIVGYLDPEDGTVSTDLDILDVSLNDLTSAAVDRLRRFYTPGVVRFDPPTDSIPARLYR